MRASPGGIEIGNDCFLSIAGPFVKISCFDIIIVGRRFQADQPGAQSTHFLFGSLQQLPAESSAMDGGRGCDPVDVVSAVGQRGRAVENIADNPILIRCHQDQVISLFGLGNDNVEQFHGAVHFGRRKRAGPVELQQNPFDVRQNRFVSMSAWTFLLSGRGAVDDGFQ